MPIYSTIIDYEGDGSNPTFAVTFPYLDKGDVEVYVAGVLTTSLTWPNAGQVTLTSAPALGASVRIKRNTPHTTQAVVFTNGSVLQGSDLNTALLQVLYAQQELADLTAENLANAGTLIATTGNVPAPADPAADNMILRALAGGYGWTDALALNSAVIVGLTATAAIIGGGTATLSAGTVTNAVLTNATASNLAVVNGGTLSLTGATGAFKATSAATATSVSFAKPTVSATYPQFTLKHSGSAPTEFAVEGTDGTSAVTLIKLQRAGTNLVKFGVDTLPTVDSTLNLGSASSMWAGVYIATGGLHTARVGALIVQAGPITITTSSGSTTNIAFASASDDSVPAGASASWSSGVADKLYVRKDGLYVVHGTICAGTITGCKWMSLVASVGGTIATAATKADGAVSQNGLCASGVVRLSAGDYIQMAVGRNYATSESFASARLSAYWMGD